MAALNNVLGGGMSSRLFQEVREKRGLAYAVYSYHQGYSDAGAIKTYVGSTTGNVEEAVRVITEQLAGSGRSSSRRGARPHQAAAQELDAARAREHRRQDEPHRRSVITGTELLSPGDRRAASRRSARGHKAPRRTRTDLDNMYLSAVGPKELDLGRHLNGVRPQALASAVSFA